MAKEQLNSRKIIKRIKERKKDIQKYSVKKLGIFGSYIKNKQHKKSDIDVIVTFHTENFDNYAGLLLLLEKILKRKIDLVIEKDIHPEFKYIKKEAKYVRL